MTKEELAEKLNGRECFSEITDEEALEAKLSRLVVAYPTSDDFIVFKGVITNEILARENMAPLTVGNGTIEIRWAIDQPYSWTFKTDIPHATFDILEDGEPFCRGIVFSLADVGTSQPTSATSSATSEPV